MASLFGGFFAHSFLPWSTAILIMIICYGVFALFAIVTLPVELDASRRALAWVKTRNIVTPNEYDMAQDALKWAAMTYVVAAIGAITMLAYYVMQYLGGRD
jgi:Zn-dependent membrane protease YugP